MAGGTNGSVLYIEEGRRLPTVATAAHLAADGRIEAAAPGWTGRSAAALAQRAARWSAVSTALVTRIGEHAQDLHTCAARNKSRGRR